MSVAQIASISQAKQARIIDELGALKAQIATLQDQYDQKISIFKDQGAGEYVGKVYKVTVVEGSRSTLDAALVKGLLTPAQIIGCTKTSVSISATVRGR